MDSGKFEILKCKIQADKDYKLLVEPPPEKKNERYVAKNWRPSKIVFEYPTKSQRCTTKCSVCKRCDEDRQIEKQSSRRCVDKCVERCVEMCAECASCINAGVLPNVVGMPSVDINSSANTIISSSSYKFLLLEIMIFIFLYFQLFR